MNGELLNRGRLKYIDLNKRFLEAVETGTSWEDLQPLVEEMKSLAIYLQQIPTTTEIIIPAKHTKLNEATDMEEPLV
jgi:hypothetical protein